MMYIFDEFFNYFLQLMHRGEKLENLMAKSKDMSNVSVDFYKNAKKTNKKCCMLI